METDGDGRRLSLAGTLCTLADAPGRSGGTRNEKVEGSIPSLGSSSSRHYATAPTVWPGLSCCLGAKVGANGRQGAPPVLSSRLAVGSAAVIDGASRCR